MKHKFIISSYKSQLYIYYYDKNKIGSMFVKYHSVMYTNKDKYKESAYKDMLAVSTVISKYFLF